MKKKTKILALVMCAVMLVGASVLGTLAWLTDKTDTVTNTFTVGNIDIELAESKDLDLKMIPGKEIAKDPVVTVKKDSEACWLFVKIEESSNFDDFMTYTVASGWNELDATNYPGVYYREVDAADVDIDFYVLADADPTTTTVGATGSVLVLDAVDKDAMDALTTDTLPTLTFTAYAVQKDGVASAAAAWGIANPVDPEPEP